MQRPPFIKHYAEIQQPDDAHYPGSEELLSIGSPFGTVCGLQRMGVHHELLLPGRRTSYPHAEADEEEFIYVIEGCPDVWIDGELYPLQPGDGVGFPSGTGIAHTCINNTDVPVRLLVIGEKIAQARVYYPKHPERQAQIGERWWTERLARPLGAHSGLPDQRKVR